MPETCAIYLPHKKRRCKFPVCAPDDPLCVFHSLSPARIPCPLDPNHTVVRSELDAHLKRCSARAPDVLPPWYVHNCNLTLDKDDDDNEDGSKSSELADLDRRKVDAVIDIARSVTESLDICERVEEHEVMRPRIDAGQNPKHAHQQSSIIGHLRAQGLLEETDLFVEWGAGRAELSRYIHRTYLPADPSSSVLQIPAVAAEVTVPAFLLIDRDSGRLKHDRRMLEDRRRLSSGDAQESHVVRKKVDIAHIAFDTLLATDFASTTRPTLKDPRITSVSKHLCGAATDLTINCLLNSEARHVGLAVALCCHHRSAWTALHPASRAFLMRYGINASEEFGILKDLSAWYTNGLREGMDATSSGRHWTGLTHAEREDIGWRCKRAIDMSRVVALEASGWKVELIKYVGLDITRECVALVARHERR